MVKGKGLVNLHDCIKLIFFFGERLEIVWLFHLVII